jgi:UDPglucose--hexose-1-phosphate uridylyltransferase
MMGTLRQDPTTNAWVILAPERASRKALPSPTRAPAPALDPGCPFCPGNEHLTPPEVARFPAAGAWEQRVVPNRFPALVPDGSPERNGDRMVREMEGLGGHEVVIESPVHDERLDEMSVHRLTNVLATWRDRYRILAREPWAKAVVVFKNFGERAGTSLEHPHSQILATPVVPPGALHQYAVATRYYDDTGHCVYMDVLAREVAERARLVAERGRFAAVVPFAGRLPFETWIAPRVLQPSFGDLRDEDLPALAELLRDVLGALRRSAGDPDYNLVVQSAPIGQELSPVFLWHVRLLPRLVTAAGFELGSGMSINTVAPESAAEALRAAVAVVPAP